MRAPLPTPNVALVGFMGTGKSSVGQLLAVRLRFDFIDTDEMIEAEAQKPISDLFEQEGEAAFRAYERRVVAALAERRRTVISTGGGLAANADNLASLKEHSVVICLWASPETIWQRVRRQRHRPLLRDTDPLATIRRLLAEREPFYRQADVMISTERRSIPAVAQNALHEFRAASGRHWHV